MKDDQFYILCEFDNESSVQQQDKTESKPIQVACASWLIFDEERPRKPIADLIHDKEQVLLKWPSNYDVKSKEVMSKRSDIRYGQAVATILAQSDDWATIVEASKSVKKFGVPFHTRGMRATFTKRQDDVKVSLCHAPKKRKTQDKVCQELESRTSSAKLKKPRLGNITSADAELSAAENDGTHESDSDDGVVALAIYVAEKSKLKRKNQTINQESKKIYKKILDHNESSDSDDISSSYSPSNNRNISQRNLILEAENKKLKQELRALRASELIAKTDFDKIKDDVQVLLSSAKSATTLVDELKTLKKVVADLKEDMKHLQSRTNGYVSKSKCEPNEHGVHLSQNKNSMKTVLSSKPSPDKMIEKVSTSLSSKLAMEKRDEDKSSTSAHGADCETIGPHEKPISDPENVSANPQVSKRISLEIKEEDPYEVNEGGYDNLDDEKVDFKIEENFRKASPKPKSIATTVSKISIKQKSTKMKGLGLRPEPVYDPKAVFKFGVVSLTGEELARCKHSGKVSHLVSDLFVKIFTRDEMALGNLTGKTPNGHKKYVVKKKLDEERVKSIVDYVATFLEKEVSREKVANEVVKAISVKLNNYIKTEEAKKIVQNYIRENPDQLVIIKEGDGNQSAI